MLRLKADAVSNVVLMDEAMTVRPVVPLCFVRRLTPGKVLENRPSAAFWTALSHSLQKHSRDSTRSSINPLFVPFFC